MAAQNFPIRKVCLALALFTFGAMGCGEVEGQQVARKAAVAGAQTFPLSYKIVDPDNIKNATLKPGEKLPPLIVMFPGGKTNEDKDATGPIGRLESFRGKSKLMPESNENPGLPVVLSGLRFHERKDATGKLEGYDIELQGEFNAVRVAAPADAMQDFLDGKRAAFELESRLDYKIIATVSTTKLEISRDGDKLFIWGVEGDFSFREAIFNYKSPSLKISPPRNRPYLYYGVEGKLPDMRIL
ncbi:hypothetical protein [Anatilimnocola floriformis]|uniref:hypothetical protein n=1 Tax=Anatilimnocola floriformis TaxID=2948575 RepID=UPI0020C51942|nr:hypothetical protein [Anatilimnocola floriformis]